MLSEDTILYAYSILAASAVAGLAASPGSVAKLLRSASRVSAASIATSSWYNVLLVALSMLFHTLWTLLIIVHGLVVLSRFWLGYGLYQPWASIYAYSRPLLSIIGCALLLSAGALLALRLAASVVRRLPPRPLLIALEAVTIGVCLGPRLGLAAHIALGLLAAALLTATAWHYARASRLYARSMLRV